MDIVEWLRKFYERLNKGDWNYATNVVFLNNRLEEAADEIERLREALQKIADIEHEDIPAPRTPNEGTTWTVLAMAVGLAEKALKGDE